MKKITETEMKSMNGGGSYTETCPICGKKFTYTYIIFKWRAENQAIADMQACKGTHKL